MILAEFDGQSPWPRIDSFPVCQRLFRREIGGRSDQSVAGQGPVDQGSVDGLRDPGELLVLVLLLTAMQIENQQVQGSTAGRIVSAEIIVPKIAFSYPAANAVLQAEAIPYLQLRGP